MTKKSLYFNAKEISGYIHNEYVCWIDVMGTKNTMYQSVMTSANFIFKLHSAAIISKNLCEVRGNSEELLPEKAETNHMDCENLENITHEESHTHSVVSSSNGEGITLYPVMDGVYVTSKKKGLIIKFLKNMYKSIAEQVVSEEEYRHFFVIKGTLAYGPIIHGSDITAKESTYLYDNMEYTKSILIGLPMIQAFTSENLAPPFGIYVHESARAFFPGNDGPLPYKWWRWWINNDISSCFKSDFVNRMNDYYSYCEKRYLELDYSLDKIVKHKEEFNQYFENHD